MSDDIEQMRLNQFRKNERLRTKISSTIDKFKESKALHNYNYVFEFDIPYQQLTLGNGSRLFTKTLVTKKNKIFTVKSISSATILVGNITINGSASGAARIDIEPSFRNYLDLFRFDWQFRDSGSDGQWQNAPLPSNVLLGGAISPLKLSHGRVLKGGTEITCDVFVTAMNAPSNPGIPITSVTLQMLLSGVEHE